MRDKPECGVIAFDPAKHAEPDFEVDGKAYVCLTYQTAKEADRKLRYLAGIKVRRDIMTAFENRQKLQHEKGAR